MNVERRAKGRKTRRTRIPATIVEETEENILYPSNFEKNNNEYTPNFHEETPSPPRSAFRRVGLGGLVPKSIGSRPR